MMNYNKDHHTLIQRFDDEFSLLRTNMTTPVAHKTRLQRPTEQEKVNQKGQKALII